MGKENFRVVPAARVHTDYRRTEAQEVMQADMERINVMKASGAFTELAGSPIRTDPQILELTTGIINRNADLELSFSLRQWGIIHMMLDQAVVAGHNHAIDELNGATGGAWPARW